MRVVRQVGCERAEALGEGSVHVVGEDDQVGTLGPHQLDELLIVCCRASRTTPGYSG